ncbi:hypothetical protein AAKU67_003580 [Oxalobacteraceae bacterium GrIS 2.11]
MNTTIINDIESYHRFAIGHATPSYQTHKTIDPKWNYFFSRILQELFSVRTMVQQQATRLIEHREGVVTTGQIGEKSGTFCKAGVHRLAPHHHA